MQQSLLVPAVFLVNVFEKFQIWSITRFFQMRRLLPAVDMQHHGNIRQERYRNTFTQLNTVTVYTVSQKSIPDIFNCNLKTNYQILILSVQMFLTQVAIKWQFSFPPYPTFVSILPGESTNSEISLFYPMQCDCLINTR